MLRSLLLMITLFASCNLALAGDSFVRYATNPDSPQDAALQTAVGHFSHPDHPGLEIVLYGVVHIADRAYYASVQKDLDSYTKVLYEMVIPGKDYKPSADDKMFAELQAGMGKMLGLTSQKVINYKSKNLVHADMTMSQVKKALGGESLNPMGGMVNKDQLRQMLPMLKAMGNMGGMGARLKTMMAQKLASAGTSGLPGKMGKVILNDRNEVVMKVLDKQLKETKTGKIAIFYGAAHHPDFVDRLARLGWSQNSKRWMTAWKIGQGPGTPDAPAPSTTKPENKVPAPSKKPAGEWF
jgi:hypothetical protein